MGYTYEELKRMGAVPANQQPAASSIPQPKPVSAPASSSAPVTASQTGSVAPRAKKRYTYEELVAQGATPAQQAPATSQPDEPKGKKENFLSAAARGIFGAPATLVARPFQAAAALGGATNEQIDEATKKIPLVGGIIAPAPDDLRDVKKDVGRAAQTVALGTGAPIAGGALFGVGTSLEEGNDLVSLQTAFDAALGGAGGKVLEIVGKPLLSATGKVIGTITPQTLKDVAAGGAKSIEKFMQENQLLGGTFAPTSQKIASTLQGIDDAIVGGTKSAATATGQAIKEQYPNISAQDHYKAINKKDILRPTTVNEPKYAKSTRIYEEAKNRGMDLEEVATERGIVHDKIAEGGRYNTLDTVEDLREQSYKAGDDKLRPALRLAESEARRIPVSDVRTDVLKEIDNIPASQITPEDRQWMRDRVLRKYADASPAASRYENGYTLTDLHDNRIISQKNGKYKADGNHVENRPSELARIEGRVFARLLDDTVPVDLPIQGFRKELEKNFRLADYLEALHNKAVPEGITKKAVRLFGRAVAATVGGKVGGFPGSILGAQYGDILFGTFEALPNPVKMRVLSRLKVEDPKVFNEIVEYISKKGAQMAERPLLPAAGQTSRPTLFTAPGGRTSQDLQEAVDASASDLRRPKKLGDMFSN